MKPYPRTITTTSPFAEIPTRQPPADGAPRPTPSASLALSHETSQAARLKPNAPKPCGLTAVTVFVSTDAGSPAFNNGTGSQTERNLYTCAPGAEAVRVGWTITRANQVTSAKFELYCAAKPTEAVATTVWEGSDLGKLVTNPVRGALPASSSNGQGSSGDSNGASSSSQPQSSAPTGPRQPESLTCTGSADLAEVFALSDDFPGHLPTAERGPYRVKLTIATEDVPVFPNIAWTHFDVQVAGVEFVWPDDLYLPHFLPDNTFERDRVVCTALSDTDDGDNLAGRVPAPGEVKTISLASNVFYRTSLELQDGRTYYQRHQEAWGDGPNIPLVAKILLKSSTGGPVFAPKAVGKLKVFWDWQDRCAVGLAGNAGAQDFVRQSMAYKPLGTADAPAVAQGHGNCHVDRGGKRGPDARPVFPAQPGIAPVDVDPDDADGHQAITAFPFKVTLNTGLTSRKWTSVSETWPTGVFAGTTGVVFQPSRMAGDGYELHAWVMNDTAQEFADHADQAAPQLHGQTGTFQVWRTFKVPTVWRLRTRSATGTLVDLAAVTHRFSTHFVRVLGPDTPLDDNAAWFEALARVIAGQPPPTGTPLEDYVVAALEADNQDYLVPVVDYDTWYGRMLGRHDNDEAALLTWAAAVTPRNDPTGAPIFKFWKDSSGFSPLTRVWPLFPVACEGEVSGRVLVEFLHWDDHALPVAQARVTRSVDLEFAKPRIGNRATALTDAQKTQCATALAAYYDAYASAYMNSNLYEYQFGATAAHHHPVRVRLKAKTGNDRRSTRLKEVQTALHDANKAFWRAKSANTYQMSTLKYAWIPTVIDAVIDQLPAFEPGMTVLQMTDISSGSVPNGKAFFARDEGRVLMAATMTNDPAPSTLDHEVGHGLFLNHVFWLQEPADTLRLHQRRPATSLHCTMNPAPSSLYVRSAATQPWGLCGFCSLRMRGWSVFKVTSPDGATLDATERTLWHDAAFNQGQPSVSNTQVEEDGTEVVKQTATPQDPIEADRRRAAAVEREGNARSPIRQQQAQATGTSQAATQQTHQDANPPTTPANPLPPDQDTPPTANQDSTTDDNRLRCSSTDSTAL